MNLKDIKNLDVNDFKSFMNGRTMILNQPNQEPPTYKEISTNQIILNRNERLGDLESFILNSKNRVINNHPCFLNPSIYCMKTVRDYMQRIAQLHDEFPFLKNELDIRIKKLIEKLQDQSNKKQVKLLVN